MPGAAATQSFTVVVHDLDTGSVSVVHRGGADRVQLAGRYLAFARGDDRVVVTDLRTGRVAYRAKVRYADYFSLGADGTLAPLFPVRCCSLVGRLGWYSPRSPRLHRLPNRVAVFSGPPLVYAAGRIAYVSRYDHRGATLSVTDLRGRSRHHASFHAPEQLESFGFDGARLAFAHTRYRPDQGSADDGLHSFCDVDRILVQESASVIEVHPVTAAYLPGRCRAPPRTAARPANDPSALPHTSPGRPDAKPAQRHWPMSVAADRPRPASSTSHGGRRIGARCGARRPW